MEKIKICYSDKANIGDAINPYIVREVLGYEPVLADAYHCRISGIGSGLRRFFVKKGSKKKKTELTIKKLLYRNPVILWSSGFISTPTGKEFVSRKNITVASVRGELSRQYVEKLLGRPVECTTGDGGLLCSRWIPAETEKKYRLGIIPHVREKEEEIFEEIHRKNEDSVIIDVEDDPAKNLSIISSCECIISSSLHGLIISDSYCIPNRRIIVSDKLAGDGFKFRDYYSSFGFEDEAQDLNTDPVIDTCSIIGNYRFGKEMILKKQEEIISAFHKYL